MADSSAATPPLNLRSLDDLFTESPEDWEPVIEGMWPLGATSLLAAKPKVGKTTTAETMMYGVATGSLALGHPCAQGAVLYVQLEASSTEVASHFKKMGATGQEPIHLHIGPVLGDAPLAIENAIRLIRPKLVVVDFIQRLLRFRDIKDYSEVTSKFEPYLEMAHTYGPHMCFLHHLGKEEHANNVSDAILGSTALFASVDLALIMLKSGGVRTIQTDGPQRFGINILPTVLKYDPETGMVSAGEELAKARSDELRQRIMNALGDLKLTMLDLKKAVGGDNAKTHSEVLSLYRDGFLERFGSGKSGDPYLFWVRQPPDSAKPNGHGYQAPDAYANAVRKEAEESMRQRDQNPLFRGTSH